MGTVTDRWAGRPAVVVGDAMLDEWLFADAERVSREAPAPVFTVRRRLDAAGGAANTAVNLARLGARTTLLAPVGADEAGARLRRCLAGAGVVDRTVPVPDRATPVKRRLVAADQIVAREDDGEPPPAAARWRLLSALRDAVASTPDPLLVVCDYGLGSLDGPVREWLVGHRDALGTVALDAHDLRRWQGLRPSVVAPSLAEAARSLGWSPRGGGAGGRPGAGRALAAGVAEVTGAALVAVTLDADGAVVVDRTGTAHRTRADRAPASHTVGAGDAYLAAAALAVAAGDPPPAVAEVAQRAAASTVSTIGTGVCDPASLDGPAGSARKIVDAAGLSRLVAARRRGGGRVVFTNGCFDVLHRGHVACLEQARRLGDALVVAVNSDASVRRLKGPRRPVNPVEDRAAVLAALTCVDAVVVFEEDSPAALIERVRPDLYVKGGDYPPELVPEAPLVRRLGGEVRILDYLPDRSTSAVIDRIRRSGTVSA